MLWDCFPTFLAISYGITRLWTHQRHASDGGSSARPNAGTSFWCDHWEVAVGKECEVGDYQHSMTQGLQLPPRGAGGSDIILMVLFFIIS